MFSWNSSACERKQVRFYSAAGGAPPGEPETPAESKRLVRPEAGVVFPARGYCGDVSLPDSISSGLKVANQ
jgi:hypothetical protein